MVKFNMVVLLQMHNYEQVEETVLRLLVLLVCLDFIYQVMDFLLLTIYCIKHVHHHCYYYTSSVIHLLFQSL